MHSCFHRAVINVDREVTQKVLSTLEALPCQNPLKWFGTIQ